MLDRTTHVRLTADLGNSGLKLAAWRPLSPAAVGAALPAARLALPLGAGDDAGALAGGLDAFLATLTAEVGPVDSSALSSVAGSERTAALTSVLDAALGRVGGRALLRPDHGLENTCAQPQTVGADRLFAARGALELVGGGAVVVDVGSALTVDAVAAADRGAGDGAATDDRRGRFLGGAIAPGPRLAASALERGGAQLPLVDPDPRAPALGRETTAALISGIVHGLRGGAFELARRVGAEAGLAAAPRVLTGGARAFLTEPEPFWDGDLRVDPDLVHRGLLAALLDAEARR